MLTLGMSRKRWKKKNPLTTNQSNVETNTTGLAVFGSGTITITRDVSEKWQGAASLKVVTDGTNTSQGCFINPYVNITAGQIYTFSAYLKGSGTVCLRVRERDGGNVLTGVSTTSTAKVLSSSWTRYDIQFTPVAGAAKVDADIFTSSAQAITFYADGLQIEKGSVATKWVLGKG